MKSARSDYESKWDQAEKQYEAKVEQDLDKWQSDYYYQSTTSFVEGMLAEMIDQSPEPFYLPREPGDEAAAKIANYLFQYTWDIGKGDIELYKVLKSSLLKGTGIAQEYYLCDEREIRDLIEYDPEKQIEKYEKKKIKRFDDVYMEYVKLEDFYIDDRSRGFSGAHQARDCARRYVMHIDDFKNFFQGKIWDNLGNAKFVQPGGDLEYYEWRKPPEGLDRDDLVEVFWYWNVPDDRLVIVANGVIVRDTPNPYRHKRLPFARCVDVMNPDHFYGKGEAELLEKIEHELNIIRRQRIDTTHLKIDPMWLVSSRENLNEDDLIARPHGMIEVEDPLNSIKPLEYSDIARSAYLEEDRLKEDANRVTGFDDRMLPAAKGATATEAAILKESTLRRIRLKLRLLEGDFLRDVADLRWKNIQQFYSVPKVEEIVGSKASDEYKQSVELAKSQNRLRNVNGKNYEEKNRHVRLNNRRLEYDSGGNLIETAIKGYSFFEIKPNMVKPDLDVRITAGSTLPISKPLLQQQTEAMYDRLIRNPAFDPEKLGEALLKVHDMNPEEFKKSMVPGQPGVGGQPPPMGGQQGGPAPGSQPEGAMGPVQAQPQQGELQKALALAEDENKMIMKGQQIAPTPYAPPQHTDIHLAFLESEPFKQLPNDSPIVKVFAAHIVGEMEAQKRRFGKGAPGQATAPGALGTPPPAPPMAAAPPPMNAPPPAESMQMNAVMPGFGG